MATSKLRILAIEPDAACREHLQSLLAGRIFADVIMVANADAAAATLRSDRPDLILVSAVLPPRAEEQIVKQLKEVDPDGMVPVLTIPPVMERAEDTHDDRGLLRRLTSRRPPKRLSYDPAALTARIGESLTQLRHDREFPRLRIAANSEPSAALALFEPDSHRTTALSLVAKPDASPLALQRRRLHRARRLTQELLPHRCTLTTPAGFIVRMVNVSATGVLFESPLKFIPESETSLSLLGPQSKIELPSRIVRSEVSAVTGLGVTYQTAASFQEKVELFSSLSGPTADVAAPAPALADLLFRVTTELYQNRSYEEARLAFETGMRLMVPSCDVKLSDSLIQPADGGDSVYFTVPAATPAILQATFDPGHEPSREEFKLLKAAAAVASILIEYESGTLIARTA